MQNPSHKKRYKRKNNSLICCKVRLPSKKGSIPSKYKK